MSNATQPSAPQTAPRAERPMALKGALAAFGALALAAAAMLAPGPSTISDPWAQQDRLIAAGAVEGKVDIEMTSLFSGRNDGSVAKSVGLIRHIEINRSYDQINFLLSPSLVARAWRPSWRAYHEELISLHERAHVHFDTAMPRLADGPSDAEPFLSSMAARAFAHAPPAKAGGATHGNNIQETFADTMGASWLIRSSDPARDADLKAYLHAFSAARSANFWTADHMHDTRGGLGLVIDSDWSALRKASPEGAERFALQATTAGAIRQIELLSGVSDKMAALVASIFSPMQQSATTLAQRGWLADARAGRPQLDPIGTPYGLSDAEISDLRARAAKVHGADPLAGRMEPVPLGSLVLRLASRRAALASAQPPTPRQAPAGG